jgi:hypothetical protein
MNSFLKALRLAAVCLLPFALMAESDDTSDAKASTPMGELYLSLPFCQDQALAHAFPIRAVELKRAVALEKESGACFKRLASIHPEFEGSGEEGLRNWKASSSSPWPLRSILRAGISRPWPPGASPAKRPGGFSAPPRYRRPSTT